MSRIVVISEEELEELITRCVKIAMRENNEEGKLILYTINEVATKLRKAHLTVKSMVAKGIIKATPDNRITSVELNRYLGLKD